MNAQAIVNEELQKIHHKRNRVGYFPNIASLLVSVYFQREELLKDSTWLGYSSFILTGTIIRILINETFFKEWCSRNRFARFANFLAFLLLGSGWGWHFYDVHAHYGGGSPNVSYTLLIIIAFITGSSTSLVADKVSYYTFVLSMSLIAAATYLTDPQMVHAYVVINIGLYLLFSLSNYDLSNKQLCDLLYSKEAIKEQEAKAHYSSKLASLGEMAAGIAHEVNNPLTIIQGSASILKRLAEDHPINAGEVKSVSDKIIDTTQRISKTIKSLKALSRNGENDPKVSVNLKKMLDQCLDVCGQRFRQNHIELKVATDIASIVVFGREVELSQVMLNLLSNSIDAIKDTTNPWVSVEVYQKGKWLDILVIDSGPGIPTTIQRKIMDPFFTTKDVNQGTGLGLSISKSIVANHGGELSLLNQERNTTFRIRLPRTLDIPS